MNPLDLKHVSQFDEDGKKRTQSEVLLEIGQNMGELFHDAGGDAYVSLRRGHSTQTYQVASSEFREILHGLYYSITGLGCNRNALADAVATLTAQAKFEGESYPVYLRVGMTADDADDASPGTLHRIEIDTGNAEWDCIRISTDEIKVTKPSCRFKRAGKPLPLPAIGEPDFGLIWKYLSIPENQRPLVAAFMLAALRPTGPFPALVSQGEQGSTKSTLCKVVKRFIDPSASPLRSPPREGRDLQVAAMNSWLPAWDNLSYLSPDLSDDLCRLATGTAMASRRLYSDHDEVLVELQRPTIINGIEDLTTRPDLASRSLVIECQVPETRKRESDFWREIEQDAPQIFAGLLAGVQQALKHQHEQPATAIRMADLAAWANAGETALGFEQGAFIEAYAENQQGALTAGLEVSPVGQAVKGFMQNRSEWQGSASELIAEMERVVSDQIVRQKSWPRAPHVLTQRLIRLAPALRAAGYGFEHGRESGQRWIHLCKSRTEASFASQSVIPKESVTPHDAHDAESGQVHKEWTL